MAAISSSPFSKPRKKVSPPPLNNRNHGSLYYPPPPSSSLPILYPFQPPLLPLPISQPRSLSTSKRFSRNKTKKSTKISDDQRKRDSIAKEAITASTKVKSPIVSSTLPAGPDPSDLTKDLQKFSAFIFTASPPPSSLPLPKFSVRPKAFSCTAETVGIDAGATDDLRRLLRLR